METFSNIDMLEPLELFKSRFKDAYHNNAETLFDEMEKKSGINVDANQEACGRYYKEVKTLETLNKTLSKKKVGRGFALFFGILLCIALVGIPLLVLASKLKKQIADLDKTIGEHQTLSQNAMNDALNAIAGLNNQYEWNMAAQLMNKVSPLIKLDQVFDPEKFSLLNERYGYEECQDNDSSSVYVQSGSILGNPFVFKKTYNQNMVNHRYTGKLTITYSKQVYDGKNWRTQTVTEVLTAHLDKPEPNYFYDTTLIFGSEAAPNLSFSRKPTGANNMNDKEIEKYVRRFDKDLDKKVAKSVSKGGGFTRLGNEEFEALFNALDRDNEIEFRLLFTPLAQLNICKLLKDKTIGFGDDFTLVKKKKLNYITSGHMNASNSLDRNPESIKCFDYKNAKEAFVSYCDEYVKNIYFDFAPLLSIPLYQQMKAKEYMYGGQLKHFITQSEVECAANSHDINVFKHPATKSAGVILKSKFDHTVGNADLCTITAHSFEGIDRVTLVPKLGGDGKWHDVPVYWTEYLPISKETKFGAADTNANLSGYKDMVTNGKINEILSKFGNTEDSIYKKRILSFFVKD